MVELLGEAHPELREQRERVAAELAAEEERFLRTLETGGRLLDEVLAGSAAEISAEDAFRLHDTYGFPIELTVEIAAEHGKTVDEAGFAELMDEQRDRARAAVGTRVDTSELRTDFTTEFVGYERLDVTTQVGAAHDRERRLGAREAARVAVLRPRRRPGGRPRLDRDRLGPRRGRGRRPGRRRPGGRRPARAR